jgi:predicted AAA+ superfamily ATPase
VPVGYIDEIEMFPLDLMEFFEAIGISNEVIMQLRICYRERHPIDEFIHERMLEAVRLYLIVGGMPALVQRYVDTNNLREVATLQRSIIRTYKRDISQYDLTRKLLIEEIYNLVPSELNASNKRFILKELHAKARYSRYESGFMWLKDAGVVIPTYNIESLYCARLHEI